MIRITASVFILLLINLSCNDSAEKDERKKEDFVIKPEYKKYEHYISDARFKVYLKMGAKRVAIKDDKLHTDSLLLGAMNLSLASCEEKNNGLMVDFIFRYRDSSAYINNSPLSTSSIFYRNKNAHDWFFAYGDLRIIYFDSPNQIDTLQLLQHLNKGDSLNPWFKKRIEDSILNDKSRYP